MNVVKENAYAKINLFLDVLSRRDDGFHSISTVMHSVSLCDLVTVQTEGRKGGGVRIMLEGNRRLPADGRNLAVMAANEFLKAAAIDTDVTIKLNKRIPIAAGLAGGSSNAAAVLRALNKLFKRPFTDKMLLNIAARLGSDVPYCLVGGTALCEGRGEKITRLKSIPTLHTVISIARERVSTPFAYATLDAMYSSFDGSVSTGGNDAYSELVFALNTGKLPTTLFNIFENAILPECPGASHIKKRMLELGATQSLMSGSGPSVFGIFADEKCAKAAMDRLRGEGFLAYYAKSVN